MSALTDLRKNTPDSDDETHMIIDLLETVPDINERLGNNPIIIDIGTAHGLLVKAFRGAGLTNTRGFDANPRFSEEFPGVVETAFATKLPLETKSADIAISSRLFSDPNFRRGEGAFIRGRINPDSQIAMACNLVITEVARVLREGGLYVISDDFLVPTVGRNNQFLSSIYTHPSKLGEVLQRTKVPFSKI